MVAERHRSNNDKITPERETVGSKTAGDRTSDMHPDFASRSSEVEVAKELTDIIVYSFAIKGYKKVTVVENTVSVIVYRALRTGVSLPVSDVQIKTREIKMAYGGDHRLERYARVRERKSLG